MGSIMADEKDHNPRGNSAGSSGGSPVASAGSADLHSAGGGGPLPGFQAAFRTAIVAAVFDLVVIGLLAWHAFHSVAKDPLDSPRYLALQRQLAADPQNEQLKEQIRQLDLELREAYFRDRAFNQWGTLLLIAGLITFAIAARIASALRRPLPHPVAADVWDETFERATRHRRLAVAAFGAGLIILVVPILWLTRPTVHQALALRKTGEKITQLAQAEREWGGVSSQSAGQQGGTAATGTPGGASRGAATTSAAGTGSSAASQTGSGAGTQPGGVAAAAATGPTAGDFAPAEEYHRYWPRFRGPDGSGVSSHANPPLAWDAAKGEGVLWKSPVELPGHNSPVVWENRVFLSGATEQRRGVFCFDANSGKLLWQQDIPASPAAQGKTPKVMKDTGFAAPTVATDGRRLYAIFANGDLVGLDFTGKILWVQGLGIPDNIYGHASSLCTYGNAVLVQFDQATPDDGKSRLIAFDGGSGKVLWEVKRPTGNSWTSPIVARLAGKEQLITVSDPFVISYNPADGKEWWRFEGTTGDCGPSPIAFQDLAIAGGEYSYYMYGIKADGAGDVTETHKAWEAEDALPDTCSPLAFDHYVLWMSSTSILACYDVKSGEKFWEHEFPEHSFASSPAWSDGHVYLFSKSGRCFVGKVSDAGFEIKKENELGEACVSSPAFQPGRIFIRGAQHLFCLGR